MVRALRCAPSGAAVFAILAILGLASAPAAAARLDVTITAPDGTTLADGTPMAPRIRVRDRNDVVCTAHEHTFGEWIVTTQPTCTEPGEKTRTCTGCGEVETMVIDATGHHYKDGKCTDCGAADPGYQPTQPGVKTGDESNTTMWIIVLVCAAALAVVLVIVSRKKRNS